MKSRDGYNDKFIYKYIPVDTAVSSSKNHQIWMRKTEKLNDEREQRVIPEFFQEDSWINYQWAKKIDFSATRTYYVSSFSKNKNDADMSSEYGSCIFGFKNDRLVELLSPISMRKFERKKDADQGMPKEKIMPVCSQVIEFEGIHPFIDAHVIIRTKLEKPSRINGLHYFSPYFLRLQDKYYHFISRFYLQSRTYIIGQ